MTGPLTPDTISPKLQRIAKLAKDAPDMAFRSLAHYIDIDWLREAYRRTRKDGARGVDGPHLGRWRFAHDSSVPERDHGGHLSKAGSLGETGTADAEILITMLTWSRRQPSATARSMRRYWRSVDSRLCSTRAVLDWRT